jgi:glycosyltransferase involved in cell wall biosynthesis
MPAYNCEKFIRQAIDSILNQTYTNFELLIADDCSTDNTKSIIDSYSDKRIKTFHNEKNLGYTQASNKLFSKCTGDYITFQDADDYCSPNRLELLVHFLEKNKEYSCVGSNITKVDELGEEFFKSNFVLKNNEIKDQFKNARIVMTGSSLLVKKEVLDKIGLYNLFFDRLGSEDVYWFSLILSKYKVANIKEELYYYRANKNSVSSIFKNPKTKVLHNLIVFLYKRREVGKEDYLQIGNINKADAICDFLIVIERVVSNKFQSLVKFISLSISWPSLGQLFYKDFMYKLIKQKN